MRAGGVFILLLCGAPVFGGARFPVRILDENGNAAGARVKVLDAAGRALPVPASQGEGLLAAHPQFAELGVVITGRGAIELPLGAAKAVVDRGPEYRRIEIDLGPENRSGERTLRLERWIHMTRRGWWSGDMHVHRAPGDMARLLDAADVHFAPTLTRWNARSLMDEWPASPVIDAGPSRIYSVNNAEDERQWGAALFLGLNAPVRLYRNESEHPPPHTTWSEARSQGAYIDLEKAIWWEAPVMAALIPPDSIGVAVNHFREDGISTRASLSKPRDEERYPGERGFARYILDLYSTYLSAGFRVPASAGSANGVVKIHFGHNRSYVHLGPKFSYEGWLAGQRAGRNFVTNGPMLFVSVDGRLPGATAAVGTKGARVDIEALSMEDLDRAEILVDGMVVRTITPSNGKRRIRASLSVPVSDGSWLAVRCFENSDVTIKFAHTSPFYFGQSARRSPESLAYLRAWVEADMDRLRKAPAEKLTEPQKEEFLAFCKKALARYQVR